MIFKKTLSILLFIYLVINNNCFASENPQQIVSFSNGLLTSIPAVIISAETTDIPQRERKIVSTRIQNSEMLDVLSYQNVYVRHKGTNTIDLFFPIVIEMMHDIAFCEGPFFRKSHQKAIDACRHNRALYIPMGQGVLMYDAHKKPLKPEIFLQHKDIIHLYQQLYKQKESFYLSAKITDLSQSKY
jgi:hypothetical protein